MTSTMTRHRTPAVDLETVPKVWKDFYLFRSYGYGSYRTDESLKQSSVARALAKPVIKTNPESRVSLIAVDVDHSDALHEVTSAAYDDFSIPVPNVVTVNPFNGYAHAIWLIKHGFPTNSPRAMYVAGAIREELTKRIPGGDPRYVNATTKSPFYAGHEAAWMDKEEPRDGREMLKILEIDLSKPRARHITPPDPGDCEGRNHFIFEATRWPMYSEHRRHATFETFEAKCVRTAWEFNISTFAASPLRYSEVSHIGKSVARFTWRAMHGNGTHEFSPQRRAAYLADQSSRGRRSWETLTPEQSSERHRAIALTKHGDPDGARLAQAQTMAANGKTPQQVRAVSKHSASQSRRIVAAQFPKKARIAARRAEVTRLRANGLSVAEIAARYEVTAQTIHNDIKAMNDRD